NVEGLYTDWPNKESLVSKIEATQLEAMLPQLDAGMIPKMESALNAVKGGVAASHVIDGRLAHSVLLVLLTLCGIGTMVFLGPFGRDCREFFGHRPSSRGEGRQRASIDAEPREQPFCITSRGETGAAFTRKSRR